MAALSPVSRLVPLRGIGEITNQSTTSCPLSCPRCAPILGAGMKARKLLHTRYRVSDLERTVKFYREILGLEEVRRHKSPRGSELVFLKAPESEETIEICYFPNSGQVEVQPDLTHLAFQVDSLAEFEKHLAKHGLKYSDGPHMKENGSGFAFIDAPEGYEIELMQLSKTSGGYE
jgi:lactoylglutathione lyase